MISTSDTHPHPSIHPHCFVCFSHADFPFPNSPLPPPPLIPHTTTTPIQRPPRFLLYFLTPGSLCIYNTLLHPLGSSVSLSMQPTPTVFCAILCFIYLRTLYQPPPAILYSSRSLTFYAPPFVASYFIPPLALFSSAHFYFLSHTFFFSFPFRRGRTRWME